MRDQALDYLALSLIPGLGRVRQKRLLERLGDPSRLLRITRSEMRTLGLPLEMQAYIASGAALKDAEDELSHVDRLGFRLVVLPDSAYPRLLRRIAHPPLVLYCRGDIELLRRPAVSIVGSRRCSIYGRQVTRKLARELAGLGLTVVSGLARGIDAEAHRGCLEGKGGTVAVLGTGLDIVYPRENRRLFERIAEQGCIVTEFRCGVHPAPPNFPIRNRIISGLSYGTLVSEAGEFSGSLITARLALEQDREVWAVPGNITSAGSYGPNYLIKQGAAPILSVQDILDQLPARVLVSLADTQSPEARSSDESAADFDEQFLKLLPTDSSLHIDQILERSGLKLEELNRILLDLEMRGRVVQAPGRLYSRRLE